MSATSSSAKTDWGLDRLSDHLSDVIDRTPVRRDPSPHLFIEQVFPEDFYQTLRSYLPAKSDVYQGWGIGKAAGRTHYQQRKQIYIHNRDALERFELGSPEVRDFWLQFQSWFMDPALQRLMSSPFDAELRERFGGDTRPKDGELVTNGMINFHEPGYFIGPHPDTVDRVVTAIFYLAEEGAPEELGTHFYRPKDPTYRSVKHGEFEDFIRVSTAPYRRNSAVLFIRTPSSYHGVEPISEELGLRSERYVLQYMLVHKRSARLAHP